MSDNRSQLRWRPSHVWWVFYFLSCFGRSLDGDRPHLRPRSRPVSQAMDWLTPRRESGRGFCRQTLGDRRRV